VRPRLGMSSDGHPAPTADALRHWLPVVVAMPLAQWELLSLAERGFNNTTKEGPGLSHTVVEKWALELISAVVHLNEVAVSVKVTPVVFSSQCPSVGC
jgi:hypothetical protein